MKIESTSWYALFVTRGQKEKTKIIEDPLAGFEADIESIDARKGQPR